MSAPSLRCTFPLALALIAVALTFAMLASVDSAFGQAGQGPSNFGGGGSVGGGGGVGGAPPSVPRGSGQGDRGLSRDLRRARRARDRDGANETGVSLAVALALLAVIAVGLAVALLPGRVGRRVRGGPRRAVDFVMRPLSARRRRRRGERVQAVERAATEAARDDERFAPHALKAEAEALFRNVQKAWDARDTARLATLLGPDLLPEWKRRLREFKRKRWHSRVKVPEEVEVEYVGLTNQEGHDDDRAVVRVESRLRCYVEDRRGRRIHRTDSSDEWVDLREYWTLGVRDGRWVLLSIASESDGEHLLEEAVVSSPGQRYTDTAIDEPAGDDADGD